MDQSTSSDEKIRLRRSLRLKDYDYASAGAYFVTVCTHDRQCLFGEIVASEMTLNEIGQIAQDQWHQLPKRFENIELDAFIVMPDHIHGVIFIIDQSRVGVPRGLPPVAGFTPAQDGNGQPDIGQPDVGQPDIGQPDIGQPEIGQPDIGQPDIGQPEIGQPEIGQPDIGQPDIGQPDIGQPDIGQPDIGQPQGLPLRGTIGDIVGTYKSLVAHECLKIYKANNEFMGKLWQRNYYEHIIRDEFELNKIRMYIEGNPLQPV